MTILVFGGTAANAADEIETAREAAVAAAREGRHEEAIATLEELLRKAPQSTSVRRDLGVVLSWAGLCSQSLETLAPLLEGGDQPAWVVTAAATCLRQTGGLDEAARLLEASMAGNGDPGLRVSYAAVWLARDEPDRALEILDTVLKESPGNVEGSMLRGRVHERLGEFLDAYRDFAAVLEVEPEHDTAARLAAYNLLSLGAPRAAERFLDEHPVGKAGPEGEELLRQLRGDRAARHIRWGWAEPVFDPDRRRHEAEAAIGILEAERRRDPQDRRAIEDLLLAYRLADRMADVVGLWEDVGREGDPPSWARNAAADAYLYLGRTEDAGDLYRSLVDEQPERPEGTVGLYWVAIEERRFGDAADRLDELGALPGQALAAEIQRGWYYLFADRLRKGQRHFEHLLERHPGEAAIREGLAASYGWQGWPRSGLRRIQDVLTRTTLVRPFVDRASARIARAGGLVAVGDLAEARTEAEDLVRLYPENQHAQRLARDVDTVLSPEVRLDARHDTSDQGLDENWLTVEVSVPVGTRTRVAAGAVYSRTNEKNLEAGDTEQAYLGLLVRASRWLQLSHEVDVDISGRDPERDPAQRTGLALFAGDRWRLDIGLQEGHWRDLPLRARAAGITGDSWSFGVGYNGGAPWNARFGGGTSDYSDGNDRTWGLAAVDVLARTGPRYHASFGLELYGSENSKADAVYYNPSRDRSANLTHRSEWVTHNTPRRRHTFSLLLHAGVYDQEGFDPGPVGGAWVQSSSDLAGRTALIVGAGARSQLYDGNRELDPRVYVTLRRRF